MSKLKAIFGRFKASTVLYNILHKNQLEYLKPIYKKYGIKKQVFDLISYKDLKNKPAEKPWLDKTSLKEIASKNADFQSFDEKIQNGIVDWNEKGYGIIPQLFSTKEIDTINTEIARLLKEKKVEFQYSGRKIMFAYRKLEKIQNIIRQEKMESILSFLLGKEVELFQSINFYKGSEQLAHSDSIHMSTHPEGNLIAVWIALEDISEEAGPLTYYPGSHKLPYLHLEDFDHGGGYFTYGKRPYDFYEKKVKEVNQKSGIKPQTFLPKKGDILIWHANLIHGGSPMKNPELTRKSMVLHYFAKDVVAYHEITQRPALKPYL